MSELRAATISDAAGTGPAALTGQWAAKTVFDYDQTVPSVARGDNVSSINDLGTGDFRVNFTNSFDAVDWAFVQSTLDAIINTTVAALGVVSRAASNGRIGYNRTTSVADLEYYGAFFGDLA